jgi:hypothetical protein
MEQPLKSIIGQQLSAIVFIMDYVQLQFGGLRPMLTAITLPTVEVDNGIFGPHSSGYRDRLCDRITKYVRMATVNEREAIRIEFDDGAVFAISLKSTDYRTAEAAIFDNGPDNYWVW